MAIDFIQQKKKQKYLLLIVGVMIVVILIVLWFGYFRKAKPGIEIVPAEELREIKIDFDVLKNPFLKEMQSFEKAPAFEGDVGRENPFLPY